MSPADRSNSAYFCWFGRDWVREAGTTKMRIGSMWWMMLLGSFWMVVCSIKATECAIENILNIRKYIVRPRVLYTAVATDSDARKQKGMEICHIFFLKLFARMELPRWIFLLCGAVAADFFALAKTRCIACGLLHFVNVSANIPSWWVVPAMGVFKTLLLGFFLVNHHCTTFVFFLKSPSTFPAWYEMIRTEDIDFMILHILAWPFSSGPPVHICVHCYWDCVIFLMV